MARSQQILLLRGACEPLQFHVGKHFFAKASHDYSSSDLADDDHRRPRGTGMMPCVRERFRETQDSLSGAKIERMKTTAKPSSIPSGSRGPEKQGKRVRGE